MIGSPAPEPAGRQTVFHERFGDTRARLYHDRAVRPLDERAPEGAIASDRRFDVRADLQLAGEISEDGTVGHCGRWSRLHASRMIHGAAWRWQSDTQEHCDESFHGVLLSPLEIHPEPEAHQRFVHTFVEDKLEVGPEKRSRIHVGLEAESRERTGDKFRPARVPDTAGGGCDAKTSSV